MDRRHFLKGFRSPQKKILKTYPDQLSFAGIQSYSGSWTKAEVIHLLKRTQFCATKEDIDYFLDLGADAAVDQLLLDQPAPTPPIRHYGLVDVEGVKYQDLGVAIGQTWVNDLNKASDPMAISAINGMRIESLRSWMSGLILNNRRSIIEKMVLFWHHHFSVQKEEVDNATLLYRHHMLLRNNALGNVKDLTLAVSTDPAMLKHLNGYLNSKKAPDENYARELQELMTIGKGPDSAYTEEDVVAAARVLTGWRIADDTLTSYLRPEEHDTNPKQFSAFYNNTSISNGDAAEELSQMINMIFATKEAARFICRKLYKWFVYYTIDDNTEATVIIPLADQLKSNGFEIKPVLKTLLGSEHFYEMNRRACHIKSPLDFIIGTIREFKVDIPPVADYVNGYPFFHNIYWESAKMQLDLFQPPDVSGWPSYYQEPMYYEMWVNSNSLPKRAAFTDTLTNDSVLDLRSYVQMTSDPSDPVKLVEEVTVMLLQYPLSASSLDYIRNRFLLGNSNDNSVWTNAWNNGDQALVNQSLKDLFQFLMNLPEYHLC
jgi:uncharacterized protein (DUF1800 family)